MASILDGLQRGAARSRSYFDRQTSRRLASEEGARAQTEFEQGQLADQLSVSYVRGRDNGWIQVDPEKGRIGLSDTFKEQLASGDELAQNYAIELVNAGGRGKLPEGFKVDRINQGTDAEGNTVFYVGGINEDGSKGVITTDGTSNDDSIAKAFTPDELFNQTKLAFRSKDGVLYGQRVVDLNAYANSYDLILANTQNPILEGLGSNPAAQRQAAAVIANAATPEEEVEVTNLLAESVGVPPVQLPATATSEPETESAPTDNSAQIAKLEQDIAEIDGRKTAGRPANARARAQKQRELNRLKNESQSGESEDADTVRTRGERKFAPLPAIVEEQVAPVVEGKTIPEIDEAIDNGELRVDPETAAAAARDLQEQGVETAADLAKLDPRRQAFAYAMIVASTPNDGNRRAVRDQLINILETGVSDRGDSVMKAEQIQNARNNFALDYQKWTDKLSERGAEVAREAMQEITDTIYPLDGDTDLASSARLTSQSANTLANRTFPKLLQAADQFKASGNYAAWAQTVPSLNKAVSFTVQGLAADGSPGILASLGALFNPDPSGNYDADLSNIFFRDGKLIYTQAGKPVGKPVSIGQLRGLNDNLADLVVKAAELNQAARDAQRAERG